MAESRSPPSALTSNSDLNTVAIEHKLLQKYPKVKKVTLLPVPHPNPLINDNVKMKVLSQDR